MHFWFKFTKNSGLILERYLQEWYLFTKERFRKVKKHKMKKYIKLMRITHYFKNLLIFAPVFFAGEILNLSTILKCCYALIPFCMTTSVVYVVNDLKDVEKDRRHPTKCHRPIASGEVSIGQAKTVIAILALIAAGMSAYAVYRNIYPLTAVMLLAGYVVMNLLYSNGLKDIPVIDVLILAIGFLIRLYYGSCVEQVEVSAWLYLTVLGGAFYLGMGKRRNEFQNQSEDETRVVLKKYSYNFLDKNMHVCVAFTEISYALWAMQTEIPLLMWTVPIVMVIFMKYSLSIESEQSEGNPVDTVMKDKILMLLIAIYIGIVFVSVYLAG